MRYVRGATLGAVLAGTLLAGVGCSRGGDGEARRGEDRGAPVARIDPAEQAHEERNAELSAQQRRLQPQEDAKTHTVGGRIVTATEHELVLRRDDGVEPDVKLRLAPATVVTIAGRSGGRGDLEEGAQVRASYETAGDAQVATRIEVTGGGTAQPGGAK